MYVIFVQKMTPKNDVPCGLGNMNFTIADQLHIHAKY